VRKGKELRAALPGKLFPLPQKHTKTKGNLITQQEKPKDICNEENKYRNFNFKSSYPAPILLFKDIG
jgi:hypothetical protein